jgi:hypothetical protein
VTGWPRVLARWGLPADTPKLWPDATTSAGALGQSQVVLSRDGQRFAVIGAGRVDVFPTDPGRWRATACDIAAARHDQARAQLDPLPWLIDPC